MGKRRAKPSAPVELSLIGELFEESEAELVDDLLDIEPGSKLTLYIDSAGGSVYSALSIVTLLRHRRLHASAIVLAECSSSALLVFAACAERWVTPRSTFLFHRIKWRAEKDIHSEEAANWAQHFHWLESEADRYQAELFGVHHDVFTKWINEGRFVIGPELVDLGVAKLLPEAR